MSSEQDLEPPGSEQGVDQLLELHGLALIRADEGKRIIEWSPGAARLFGYSESEARGRTLPELFTAETGAQLSLWLDGLRGGRIRPEGPPLEWEARPADGRPLTVRVTINPVKDGFHVLVSAPPAGGALLKSEGFLRAVYDASDEGMILVDLDGHIVWSNAAWYHGLGFAPAARKTPFDDIHEEDHDRVVAAWLDFKSGHAEFRDVSYRYRKGDGSEVWLETTIRSIPGQPYCYVRSRNVTEKRLLERAEERRARYLEATIGVVGLIEEAPDAARIASFLRERLLVDVAGVWIAGASSPARDSAGPLDQPACVGRGIRDALAALAAREGSVSVTGDPEEAAAGAIVPLEDSKGGRRGALVLGSRSEQPGNEELALARNLATTFSLALERQQYMDGLTRKAVTESARADLGTALLSCSSEQEVLALVLEFFEKQYGLEKAILLMTRKNGLEPVLARVDGRNVPLSGALLAPAAALSALIGDTGPRFARFPPGLSVCESLLTDGSDEATAAAARALLSAGTADRLPIGLKIPGIGVVCGFPVWRLVDPDLQANAIVLDTVAAVVKQLRMEETRRRTLRKTEQVHHLEVEVRRLPVGKPREKLHAVAVRLAEMTGAARVSILLRDDNDRRRLRSVASEDREGSAASGACLQRLYGVLARLAVASGEPVFVPEATRWEDIAGLPASLKALGAPEVLLPPFYASPIRGEAAQASGAFYLVGGDRFEDTDFAIFHDIATIVSGTLKDESLYRRQRELATRDELTRLYNRRYLLKRAAEWFRMARRYGKPFAILLMDIDRFKSINDTYGHDCGDQALVELAGVLTGAVREVDVTARYGGEEFVVLLPETGGAGARSTAERIRSAVERHSFECGGQTLGVTVSSGVATFGESSGDLDGELYAILCRDSLMHATLPGGRVLPLGITLADAGDPARLHAAVDSAAAGALSPAQTAHVEALARNVASLEGMISLADARLYRSKQTGRNRVTDGSS